MLNEKPKEKKEIDYSSPTGWKLFWRIQKECFRRSVSVFLMYMFMSMVMLACQAFDTQETTVLEIVLGVLCIGVGMFFNGHLCYNYGKLHYESYLAGCLHRKNEAYGIHSGGDHHVEKEYRFWKGLLIGLYTGTIVIIFGVLAGVLGYSQAGYYAFFFLSMFAGWAIIPVSWMQAYGIDASFFLSLAFVIIPIVVSEIFYVVGAMRMKRQKEEEKVLTVEKKEEKPRVQTEEQRRKTLQSKKKK